MRNTTEFPVQWWSETRCVSLNLYGTLPWGWICVYRPCPSDWPSCAGRTGSSDDAEDAAPCFHGRGCRPRSLCSSADHRCCCSSGSPPADFYTHTHTTLHARLSADTHPDRLYAHTPFGDTADTHTFGTFCSEPLSSLFLFPLFTLSLPLPVSLSLFLILSFYSLVWLCLIMWERSGLWSSFETLCGKGLCLKGCGGPTRSTMKKYRLDIFKNLIKQEK